jgi:hypothetical protein
MSDILSPEAVLTISGSQMLGNPTKLLRQQCKAIERLWPTTTIVCILVSCTFGDPGNSRRRRFDFAIGDLASHGNVKQRTSLPSSGATQPECPSTRERGGLLLQPFCWPLGARRRLWAKIQCWC